MLKRRELLLEATPGQQEGMLEEANVPNEGKEEMMQADQPVVEEEAVENEDEEVEDEEVEAEDEEVEAEAEVEYEAEDENEDDNVDEFGIKLAFIATRSGLMRFTEHSDDFYDEP